MYPILKFTCYFANPQLERWHFKEQRSGRFQLCKVPTEWAIHNSDWLNMSTWQSFFSFSWKQFFLQIDFVHRLLKHFTLISFDCSISRSNYTAIRKAKDLLAREHIHYSTFCIPGYNTAQHILEGPEFSLTGIHFSCRFNLHLSHSLLLLLLFSWADQYNSQHARAQVAFSLRMNIQQTKSNAKYTASYFMKLKK